MSADLFLWQALQDYDMERAEADDGHWLLGRLLEGAEIDRLALARALVPEFAVVPREPTEAMLQTFHDTIVIKCRPAKRDASVLNDIDVWTAMLAAGEARDDA